MTTTPIEIAQHVETLAAVAPDVGGEAIGLGVFVDADGQPVLSGDQAYVDERDACPNGCGGTLTITGPTDRETNVTPVKCYRCGYEDY